MIVKCSPFCLLTACLIANGTPFVCLVHNCCINTDLWSSYAIIDLNFDRAGNLGEGAVFPLFGAKCAQLLRQFDNPFTRQKFIQREFHRGAGYKFPHHHSRCDSISSASDCGGFFSDYLYVYGMCIHALLCSFVVYNAKTSPSDFSKL